MLPSASLGEGIALYEPAHGSAPDIAGQDKANPGGHSLSSHDAQDNDEISQAAA